MIYETNYGYKVSVEILRDVETDTAHIKVYAPMYIKKEWIMSHCYASSMYSDFQILADRTFQSVMLQHYPSIN
jgi:hypothetical protein